MADEDPISNEPPEAAAVDEIVSMQEKSGVQAYETQLSMVDYVDHFSLRGPSGTVRFRGARVMVYEQANDQILLEERNSKDGGTRVTVKRMRSGNFGLRFLRATYTLVSLLLLGFLFVFCFQVVLFLFLNLPVAGGATLSQAFDGVKLIGTLLSMPLFIHAMGSIMSIATAFCSDTWNGHPLFRAVMDWPAVAVEWLCFIVFLGIPAFTIMLTLFMGKGNWWELSAGTWMICVFCFFLVFCLAVAFREFTACMELVALMDIRNESVEETKWQRWKRVGRRAVLLSQTQRYSGYRDERYLVNGKDNYPDKGYALSEEFTPLQTKMSLYSKFTALSCVNSIFVKADPPTRRYTLEEIRDIVPFITNHNWSLEKMYCRNTRSRVIYAANGKDALDPNQVRSNLVCTIVGVSLSGLIVIALLLWINQAAAVVIVVAILIGFCCVVPAIRSSLALVRAHQGIVRTAAEGDEEVAEEDSEDALYQIWESLTVSRPKPWYCWTRALLDIVFLFAFPLVTLYNGGNVFLGTLFLIVGFFSAIRIYFDATWVLTELGSVDSIDMHFNDESAPPQGLKSLIGMRGSLVKTNHSRAVMAKARTSQVIGKISRSRAIGRWMWVYGIFALIALVMFLGASGTGVTVPEGGRPPIVQVKDFYYPPAPDLPYPSCEMTKGFALPGSGSVSLVDYAFVAALSYETPNITQYHLDDWFGPGKLVDEAEFVANYREKTNTVTNPVFYKLISITDTPGYGIVSIRGSQTTWDFLVDAQLWSAAGLAQLVRAFIPFGWIWTPILDDIVTVANAVESNSLKEVSYYRLTTDFVNALLENNYTDMGKSFDTLRLTGASLGGGLAVITGAQTRANAVAISGLNGALSRHTFIPPVTEEDLNQRVFNVMPDR